MSDPLRALDEVCTAHGGRRAKRRSAYMFDDAADMVRAVEALGWTIDAPLDRPGRITWMRKQVIAEVAYREGDTLDWVREGDWWYRVLGRLRPTTTAAAGLDLDSRLRSVVTSDGDDVGWWICEDDGSWRRAARSDAKCMLQSLGLDRPAADVAMGLMVRHPWRLVSRPFAPEFPGERRWNLNAVQLRHAPAPGQHPTWDMVLAHVGRELGDGGREYLTAWIAYIVRHPECRLPYLFLHGPEDSGKSLIHEAIERCLFTRGVVKADRALTSQSDFNGELISAVLCVVEERDISRTPGARAKIKEATTALTLSIRRMRTDTYEIPNHTHWLQCANHIDACPIHWGDTRIVCLHVRPPANPIPKDQLLDALTREAPAFGHTLLTMALPPVEGRLAMQVIETPSKRRAADGNVPEFISAVAEMMREHTTWQGTSGELRAALRAGNWPTDLRPMVAMLEAHGPYLRSRGIQWDCGAKSKHGRQIVLTRVS